MIPGWLPVTKRVRCPICNRPDWCMIAADGAKACCARIESSRKFGDAGWLHSLTSERLSHDGFRPPILRPVVRTVAPIDFERMARECIAALPNDALADELGVAASALKRLRYGWFAPLGCYTFPMFNARLEIIGLRTRFPDGRKMCITGSHTGLFVPKEVQSGELWIVEGPSDCAAMLTLGLNCIARPSNTGGSDFLRQYVSGWRGRDIYIIADRDTGIAEKSTLNAAERLAHECKRMGKFARVFRPPHAKDVREWMKEGADEKALRFVGNAAKVMR